MTSTVLLVEDDPDIRFVVRTGLEDEGLRVEEAATGEIALDVARRVSLDLALVDLRLPGMHGLEVVRRLRAEGSLPIIIVTAQADSHDVVAGLESGADDYVTKPFVLKELLARIRAQLRRSASGPESHIVQAGPFRIDLERAEARKGAEPLALSRTEFMVLAALVQARGRVLSREELLRDVWGYQFAGDARIVDNLVYRLRAKVEDRPTEPVHVRTVRGFGYSFAP